MTESEDAVKIGREIDSMLKNLQSDMLSQLRDAYEDGVRMGLGFAIRTIEETAQAMDGEIDGRLFVTAATDALRTVSAMIDLKKETGG